MFGLLDPQTFSRKGSVNSVNLWYCKMPGHVLKMCCFIENLVCQRLINQPLLQESDGISQCSFAPDLCEILTWHKGSGAQWRMSGGAGTSAQTSEHSWEALTHFWGHNLRFLHATPPASPSALPDLKHSSKPPEPFPVSLEGCDKLAPVKLKANGFSLTWCSSAGISLTWPKKRQIFSPHTK